MNSVYYLRGNDAIRKHVRQIELQDPEAITSTKLRKHIATLSQLLNLEERKLGRLADFLEHYIDVHRELYRLPEDTLHPAKCGKMLLLMDQGRLNEFAALYENPGFRSESGLESGLSRLRCKSWRRSEMGDVATLPTQVPTLPTQVH